MDYAVVVVGARRPFVVTEPSPLEAARRMTLIIYGRDPVAVFRDAAGTRSSYDVVLNGAVIQTMDVFEYPRHLALDDVLKG